MSRIVTVSVIALLTCLSQTAVAKSGAVTVSYLAGSVQFLRDAAKHGDLDEGLKNGAPWKVLKKGATLQVGDAVRTKEESRVELAVQDGSKLRIGANSIIALNKAHLQKKAKRSVSVSVWVGRLWAKVAKRAGGEGSFEVETRNAVAGVRGTSFTVVAQKDLSAVVRVYSGTVGVRKSAGGSAPWAARKRVQVPGPTQVDKKQWEEIIATQMTRVTISAVGKISPAEDFKDEGEELEWAMWNQQRDKRVQ